MQAPQTGSPAATGFYKTKPRHHKELLAGIAETSGLSLRNNFV